MTATLDRPGAPQNDTQKPARSGQVIAAAVAVEVGEGQAPAVAELVRGAGFERVELRRDLAGIERVVVGTGADAGERLDPSGREGGGNG